MGKHRTVFTYEDYKLLPEDGHRWEILDGDLVREPAPRPFHQIIADSLLVLLRQFVVERGFGLVISSPLDVVLSEENVLQPDIVFIPKDRWAIVTEENLWGAPALAVEVLSPATTHRDRAVKRKIYERFGVEEYWIVDPERKEIEVLSRTEAGYARRDLLREGDALTSPLFPGLSLPLTQIFWNPLSY